MVLRSLAQTQPDSGAGTLLRAARGMASLTVLRARGLDDGREALTLLRSNSTIVVQLGELQAALQQRLIDLLQGGACALNGDLTRIGTDVLLLTPRRSQTVCR